MKQVLSANSPIGFGSDVRNSIINVGFNGLEPYSTDDAKDPIAGGHARVIIGYDDTIAIPGAPIKGAFRVRNSWNTDWGDKGYSWVSYQIFIDQQTDCMGVTSENYPGNNPVPPITPSVNVAQAIANAQTAYKQTSITKAKPYIKLVETNLGG
jgi:C1A family cysteine protease